MPIALLVAISSDHSPADVAALAERAESLESEDWHSGAPLFVNEGDPDSCVAPGDEPIWTVGLVLMVRRQDEPPPTPVSDARAFVRALERFSLERGVDFELEYGDTYVGEVRKGEADRLVREGLLDRW